eukprot:236580-Prorocentrum_minimum.AAC.1
MGGARVGVKVARWGRKGALVVGWPHLAADGGGADEYHLGHVERGDCKRGGDHKGVDHTGGGSPHLAADGGGADEDHLGHVGRGDERVARLAVAGDDLDQVGRGARRLECGGDDAPIQAHRPGGVLGHLDHDRVAGEDVRHQR